MMIDSLPLWFALAGGAASLYWWLVLEFRAASADPNPDELSRSDVLERVGSREFTKAGA